MACTQRICSGCGKDLSAQGSLLIPVSNARGRVIGLFGPCCQVQAQEAVAAVNASHGAFYLDGIAQCSPIGTPA